MSTLVAGPAIVVVSYGSAALLEANLATMPAAAEHTVVVVDNLRLAADRVQVRALAERQGWVLVCNEGNPGFGAGVNAGIEAAAGLGHTTFVLLNPDARADDHVIDALAAQCNEAPMTLVSPVVVRPDGRSWFVGGAVVPRTGHLLRDPSLDHGGPWGWLTGACLAVHLDLWRAVGGFDERYFLYWEDVDLSRRCLDVGARLVVRPDLVVQHDVGGSQDTATKSAVYMYHNCRNRLLYAALQLDRAERLRWLLHTPTVSAKILMRVSPRVAFRSPDLAWAALRGSFAGTWLLLSSLSARRSGGLGR